MALQGNLRDFSATEILQLIGGQKKSGCLMLEWNTERSVVWVQEGRIVSTRPLGTAKDDRLLVFLRKAHRLSDEQLRGILTIQKESNRDVEDLLLNGRYLDGQEMTVYVERQILDDLMRIVRWDSGTYRFDPNRKWPNPPLVMMSMEGAMIEAARRVDEQKRFVQSFKDPHQLLGVRDLPDPDEPLSEEERELFGIIDGTHTIAEIVEEAPLSEYEAYEALQRMLDSDWVEFVGRRDPGASAPAPAPATVSERPRGGIGRELVVAATVIATLVGLRFGSQFVVDRSHLALGNDVFAAAHVRDLRYALDLYHRERGSYPKRLDDLVEDRWVGRDQLRMTGYLVQYRALEGGQTYSLQLQPDR
ncbi:MAG: DUF4388 domain-containing protein [Candidatus Eisenbacteria bacterium]